MVERCLIEINLLCAFMFLVMFRCVLEFLVNNIKTPDLKPKNKKEKFNDVEGKHKVFNCKTFELQREICALFCL